ncbi:type VI secretion system tube protein Hcp [Roseomonas aerophila]|uniref:Type VI secretion system tube protein Hcp n=1 Tax=Teichococcus aerophilus TaxID=1224513 RepID=A0ABR7RPN5_9PROT|nr:type VI secretion system tube protein Hcp [Pseudoroseomonas aerophila]MBC9208254.1 type VI secretion system tube protein Hcp [Pseudoroseomonas aerophila]
MAIYMKYQGVDGESTTTGYEKQIELQSFQLGVGRGISTARGTSTRESSEASVSEVTVTKQTDGASLKLFEESLYGKLDHEVIITFVRTQTGGGVQPYLRYTLTGAGVSGFSLTSGGDRPQESVSLNFDKIEMTYGMIGDDQTGSNASTAYDLATAKRS